MQGTILSCCCFAGYYIIFDSTEKKLTDFESIRGIVISKDIVARTSSSSKIRFPLDGFELIIKDMNQAFRYYTPSQNYTHVNSSITVGDSVAIYYENNGEVFLNIAQIEKEDVAITKLEEFQNKAGIGAFLALSGGVVLLGMTIYLDSKYWKR